MEEFIPIYPSADDEDIQRIITAKKEFNELSPDPNDRVVDGTRKLLNNQVLGERLATITDRMINISDPGTGKTCFFSAIAQRFKGTGAFKKVIVLQRSNTLINQTKDQILNTCTPEGTYSFEDIDEEGEALTERQRKKRSNDSLKDWYSFDTYETFARDLEELTNDQISQKYSKHIFVFDEVHNIIPNKDKAEISKQYREFKRLCHNVLQSKIIFMTATPMINNEIEIIYLMNLLLPSNNQIPFKPDYRLSELEPYFRGKITYIKAHLENINTKYMGKEFLFSKYVTELHPTDPKLDPKEKRKITVPINMYLTKMGDLQLEQYVTGKKENFNFKEKSFSSAVFPIINGVTTRSTDYIDESGGKLKWKSNTNFLNWEHRGDNITFQDWLKDINNVRRISGKAAEIIKIETTEPGCSFIYQDQVDNAGAKFLIMLFTLYGFEQFTENTSEFIFTNNSKTKIRDSYKKRPRVALITGGAYGTDSRQIAIQNLFNSPANVNGEYIKILIGSRKARDGINVYHSLRMHLFTPYWHYSGMVQAINRVFRTGGHNALIAAKKREAVLMGYPEGSDEYNKYIDVEVKVYRHCIDYNLDENIREISEDNSDYYFMKLAIKKEIPITKRMNILKACAMDIHINRPRNILKLDDPFNFDKVMYLPSWTEIKDPTYVPFISDPIDYSTYNVLYINPEKIVSKIKRILLKYGSISYDDIRNEFKTSSREDIYAAIENFRSQGKYIENEFGEKLTLEIGENGLHLQRFSHSHDPRFIHNISIYDFPQIVVIPRKISSYFDRNVSLMMEKTYVHLLNNISNLGIKDSVYEQKLEYIKELNRWKQIQILEELFKAKYGRSKKIEILSRSQIDVLISIYKGYFYDFTSKIDDNISPTWVHVMSTSGTEKKKKNNYNVSIIHQKPKRLKIFVISEKFIGWRLPSEEENVIFKKLIKDKIDKDMEKYIKHKIYGDIMQDGVFRITYDESFDRDVLISDVKDEKCKKKSCAEENDGDEEEISVKKEDKRMNQRGKETSSINKKIMIKLAVAEKIYPPLKKIKKSKESIKYQREAIKAEQSEAYVKSLTDEEVELYTLWNCCSNVAKFFHSEIINKLRSDGRLYEPYILTKKQ